MLDSIRNSANSWFAKLLLAILVVSFAAWGISGSVLTGGGSGDVVKAGKTSVSALDYRFAYDRQVSELSQRFGTRLTSEQVRALGVPQQVLSQLVAGAVLVLPSGADAQPAQQEQLLEIVVSINPYQDLVERVAGGRARARV